MPCDSEIFKRTTTNSVTIRKATLCYFKEIHYHDVVYDIQWNVKLLLLNLSGCHVTIGCV